jgi:autophagy-related protein 5
MGQLKEADFLRWGNTKRMTGLRKAEQDGMWEGIKERSSKFCFPFLLPLSIPFFPNLPKAERVSAERGRLADNFDDYWRVASKITPTTLPARPGSPPATQTSMHTRPPSADPQGMPDRDGAYNVRSVPIRLYLPEGPVLQDLAPPVLEDGGCLLPR